MTGSEAPTHAGVFATLRDTPAPARFVLFGVFVNRLGAFIQAFLVLYLVQRGFSTADAGLALGAYGVGAVLGVVFGGGFSDRLGARLTIVASMAGAAVLIVSILVIPGLPALIVVIAAVGALSQAYRPASAAVLSELIPASRQVMVFAVYRLAMNLGTVAGPLVAAALIQVSWNLLFVVEGLAALSYAAIALFALPPDPPAEPSDVSPTGTSSTGTSTTGTSTTLQALAGYRAVLTDQRYLLYLVAMLINALVYIQSLAVLPLALGSASLPLPATQVYAGLLSLNAALVVTCELLVTRWVQQWPARIAVMIGFALLGGGLSLYALPGGLAIFVIATVIWSMGEIVGGPTMFAYPAKAAPAAAKGRYLGAAHAMFGLGNAIGPPLGVALWHAVGSRAWLACGVGAVMCIAAAAAGMTEESTGASEVDAATAESAAIPASGEAANQVAPG